MSFATATQRRGLERFMAILSAIAVFMSLMVMLAPTALAHHPEISAKKICTDHKPYVHFDATSWRTDGGSGSGHPDVRIEVRVDGTGSWTEVASGAFDAGNNYRFGGDFDASAYWGNSIEVQARVVGPWDNNESGGQTRRTSMLLVDQDCTDDVTVNPRPQVCEVVQGAALGAVSFDMAPASGATVQVFTNSSYTGPIGGALGDGQALDLAPGTYYWKATAASGYDLSGSSKGHFKIVPCEASTVVVSGECAVNQQGAATGSVTVTIDPSSGATVVITGPGGPYEFAGSGGSESLTAGTYVWTATATSGFKLTGKTSGELTIEPCTASVVVASGNCAVNANGAPLGSVQVTIDPGSGATVQITGPGGPYGFSGSGGSQELVPGTYEWTATEESGFALTGDTSGRFTIDPCTSSVAVVSTACAVNANGAPLGSVQVTIDPGSGATVQITGPGGPYGFSGSGGSQELVPGTYEWTATARSGFALTGDTSGQLTIDSCGATVAITGACLLDGNVGSGLIEVEISTPGAVTVEILDGASVVGALTSSGTVNVPEGKTYTWSATPSGGYSIGDADGGSIVVETCTRPDEVLGEVIENDDPVDDEIEDEVVAVGELPFTGIDTELLFGASVVLLGSGLFLIRNSRRRGED